MAAFVQQPCDEVLIHSKAAVAPCARASGPWVLAATILGSSMAFIDGTAVNVALPALQASLGATVVQVQWVVEAYSLFLSALLLVGGSLGDHFGRRKVFLIGVAGFALASAWCGLAPGLGPPAGVGSAGDRSRLHGRLPGGGSADEAAHDASFALPFADLCRNQPADALALCGTGRSLLLPAVQPHSGAGLQRHGGRR